MIIGIKDIFKLAGITIVCFCGIFVSTFFLNYYLDVTAMSPDVPGELSPLYDAQLATARFTSAITGGVLLLIAVVMLVFYIKLFVDDNSVRLGVLKAMGYSDKRLALSFWVFGLSVFSGCALGYIAGHTAMPFIYEELTIEGLPKPEISFHFGLFCCLVLAPAAIFCGLSCLFALRALSAPAVDLMRKNKRYREYKAGAEKERAFIAEMCISTLGAKKSLVFFMAFACFCFSAMIQMGLSMESLTSAAMGDMILVIGVVLAVTTAFMSVTSLVRFNSKNVAVMKAFGYSVKECVFASFSGYVPFALLGFLTGTAYQYGLLSLMLNVIFRDVGEIPEYSFNVPVFFITLALFIAAYTAVTALFALSVTKVSVKEIMQEN